MTSGIETVHLHPEMIPGLGRSKHSPMIQTVKMKLSLKRTAEISFSSHKSPTHVCTVNVSLA